VSGPRFDRPADVGARARESLMLGAMQAWIWYDWASSVYVHTAIGGFLPLLVQNIAYVFLCAAMRISPVGRKRARD